MSGLVQQPDKIVVRSAHTIYPYSLALLDQRFEVIEMWEAGRPSVEKAILAPGSRARNERGALAVGKFKQIGTKVWPVDKA